MCIQSEVEQYQLNPSRIANILSGKIHVFAESKGITEANEEIQPIFVPKNPSPFANEFTDDSRIKSFGRCSRLQCDKICEEEHRKDSTVSRWLCYNDCVRNGHSKC